MVLSLVYWGYVYLAKNPGKVRYEDDREITGSYTVREEGLNMLRNTIALYRKREGGYPVSLDELVDKGYLAALPGSDGKEWEYNPDTGILR